MSFLSNRFELRIATEADGDDILKIYECGDFEGRISVLYTRRPNPVRSLLQEGEEVLMPVICDLQTGKIIAVGCCVIRRAYMSGEIIRTGYLTGLKILPEYRRRMPRIATVYQFIRENTCNLVDYYYTTILIENLPVQKMLEKRRKNMPVYDFTDIYTVYCFSTGRRVKRSHFRDMGRNIVSSGYTDDLIKFYETYASEWSLFPSIQCLSGFRSEDIYTIRDENGEIIAACVIWNQQDHKQYIITRYQGIYKYLSHFPAKWFGYPNFPKCGIPANYACCHMLCVKDNDMRLAEWFVHKVAEMESKYDFLMLGLTQEHPFTPVMKQMKTIRYQSKLYSVYWQGATTVSKKRIHLDVGLL